MPKKAGTRTAPSKKRHKSPSRFVTKAHREVHSLDENAVAQLLKTLKHTVPGKGKPTRE
ncbi:MAG: hypothetical protein ABL971_02810 [Vicinamibacterales bacterium]